MLLILCQALPVVEEDRLPVLPQAGYSFLSCCAWLRAPGIWAYLLVVVGGWQKARNCLDRVCRELFLKGLPSGALLCLLICLNGQAFSPLLLQDASLPRFSGLLALYLLLKSLFKLLELSKALSFDELDLLFALVLCNLLVEIPKPKHDPRLMQDALLVEALVIVLAFVQSTEHRGVHLFGSHRMLIGLMRGRQMCWCFRFFSLANPLSLLRPEFGRRHPSVVA